MKRFSKIVSAIVAVPLAMQSTAMNWACMSVGNAGYSLVRKLTAFRWPAPADRTRMKPSPLSMVGAGVAQLLDGGLQVARLGVAKDDVAAGRGHRAEEGAGLDAVGHDAVRLRGRVQPVDALDADAAGAMAFDSWRPSR